MHTAVRAGLWGLAVALAIPILLLGAYFLHGSLEDFPTDEQQSKVRIVSGTGILILTLLEALVVIALLRGNPKGASPPGGKTLAEQVAKLESAGLLTSTSFGATRSFEVEEFEDEGSHYFIELTDGSVLFLSGQYLYDYEPDFTGRRVFPSSTFTVRRHKSEGFAADIQIAGAPIEPELIAPPFTDEDFRDSLVPEDGQIIRDRTYDQLRQQFAVSRV